MNEQILAIDPGRDKLGIAVVDESEEVLQKDIISRKKLLSSLDCLLNRYDIKQIVLGDGTSSEQIKTIIENKVKDVIAITIIDESYSTREAEQRYKKQNPPSGWKKIFAWLDWKPDCAVDDYVAVILAERFFNNER